MLYVLSRILVLGGSAFHCLGRGGRTRRFVACPFNIRSCALSQTNPNHFDSAVNFLLHRSSRGDGCEIDPSRTDHRAKSLKIVNLCAGALEPHARAELQRNEAKSK